MNTDPTPAAAHAPKIDETAWLIAGAVRKLGIYVDEHDDGEIAALLYEFDRRAAVEKAAADYVMAGLCGNPSTSAELRALIAAVRTDRNFRG